MWTLGMAHSCWRFSEITICKWVTTLCIHCEHSVNSLFGNVCVFSMIDAAKINYTSGNQTLNESDTFNLTCMADGNPTPTITRTRVSDNKPVSFPLIISGKQDEGGYRCNASNGVGSPDSRIVYVFVQSKFY